MFRTELPLIPHPHQYPLSARVLTIGSCFSDSIGSRLAADKVQTLVNPFGTVFNPISACRLLRAAAGEDMDWQQHVVQARGRWQSYDLHATHGADSPVELLQNVQQLLRDTGVFLATADVVVLTLGTAWAYRLKETGELVSNCHKVPAEKFDKELLTPDEIINAVAETHAYLRLRNPKLRFVLTVSPVRHVKDTLPLNAVSKSVLRVACHYLSELLPDVSYFPAYELLLDDLRDYRFYAEDMLHPSKVAEDYIWERFARTYFDAGFGRFRKEWEAARQALSHRPLYAAAPEHRQFLESTLEKLERLSSQADMRMEILDLRRRIDSLPLPKVPEPEAEEEDDEERVDIGEYATPAVAAPPVATPLAVEEAEIEEFEEFESVSSDAEPVAADDEANAETDTEAILEALAPTKKKRRSRGGAKRNKKKHAARLAAEAAALEASGVVSVAVPEADSTETLPAPLPAVPAVVVTADAEMPLQTALERRKRNSRRGGRGRRGADAQPTADEVVANEAVEQLESAAIESLPDVEAPLETTAATQPEPVQQLPLEEEAAIAPVTSPRRAERTGRSASEKRAAALRKPHRSGSRFKTLYSSEAPAADEPTGVKPADTQVSLPSSQGPPVAAEPAPVTEAPAPVAPIIPDTQGTGASGTLSASGKASRADRPSRARPKPATPAPTAEPAPEPAEAAPLPAAPAVAAKSTPEVPASKPRRSAARAKKTVPSEEAPEAAAEALPPVAQPAKPARKSRAKASAPAADTPVTETSGTKKRNAPAAPEAALPATTEPTAPKRPRPSRRKPAAPDTPPENG